MIQKISILPGITLRCFPDHRFKQGCLSIQLIRPMCQQEAALNALIPAVLLRGCTGAPDLRSITLRLDDLYGASVGALVRRVGDYQTTGLYCGFISDRYTMDGDAILEPIIDFLGELLLQPALSRGVFRRDYVESEKKNLVATIASQRNDKRAYAVSEMIKTMCAGDSFGIPRLGEAEQVKKITSRMAYDHYKKILRESRIEIFYVGEASPETVAKKFKALFAQLDRDYANLPEQTAFCGTPTGEHIKTMDVAQGKLAMGFSTPVTTRSEDFAAMQVCNMIFGGGMTSKLFMNVRERMSLCYDISSGYHGSKGIVTVCAGNDCDKMETVRDEILSQLDACRRGDVTEDELTAAKQALITSLLGTHDTPGAIESYYATAALSGLRITPAEYISRVEQVTKEQISRVAEALTLNTVYFLKGVS
jgi:predicted Zn-dependent peptidase